MAKFNEKVSPVRATETNLAGGVAYAQDAKTEFISILLTNFVTDQYYRDSNSTLARLRQLLDDGLDPQFAAKAAIYARREFHMRSISHVVAGEIAHRVSGEQWTRPFFASVVERPDDVMEILSYYASNYAERKSLKGNARAYPRALLKGLAESLSQFNTYELAKYRAEGKEMSLRDAVNLLHPTPTARNKDGLAGLIGGTLKSDDTWESKLTKAGQDADSDEEKAELKASAWSDLILNGQIGYMALIRNLRNIEAQASPEVLEKALEILVDPVRVHKSKQLPFRFWTAYKTLENRKLKQAVSRAAEIAIDNVPELSGRTLVAIDDSGSMRSQTLKSQTVIELAMLLGVTVGRKNDADILMFSSDVRWLKYNLDDPILSLVERAQGLCRGGMTNFNLIFSEAMKTKYDRIIVLSDMQGWVGDDFEAAYSVGRRTGGAPDGTYKKYVAKHGRPFIYSIDLAGHGTSMFPESKAFALAGFSEKIFDLMKLLEQDPKALVNAIEAVTL